MVNIWNTSENRTSIIFATANIIIYMRNVIWLGRRCRRCGCWPCDIFLAQSRFDGRCFCVAVRCSGSDSISFLINNIPFHFLVDDVVVAVVHELDLTKSRS